MSDLQRTDAQWDELARRLGVPLRAMRYFVEQRDRWRKEREQVVDYDPNGNTDVNGATVSGVKLGVNTDGDGRLYQRTTGAGPYTVAWYKATGGAGGDKVAEGTGAADTLITMAEQNNSGLSGTYDLAAAVTVEADDAHTITCYPDWRLDGARAFDGTDAITGDDSKSLDAWHDTCAAIAALQDQALEHLVTFFVEFGLSSADNPVAQLAEWFKHRASSLISHEAQDSSGAISQLRRGLLKAIKQAMADETTGSTQYLIKRLMAATATTAGTNNTGQASAGTHTPEEHCPAGRYKLVCIKGLGNDGGGEDEQFEIQFTPEAGDEAVDGRTLPQSLTINKAYQAANGFGGLTGLTLQRTRSKTGDGTHVHLSDVTDGNWSEVGETERNTVSGVLNWKVVESAGSFIFRLYKGATFDADTLMAESAAVAANTAFQATARNNSGLTINGKSGSAPVDAATGTLDFNYHSTQNAAGEPDEYTIDVTEVSSGDAQRILAAVLGFYLNATTSGSETLDDGLLARANTFEPFAVKDN